MSKSADNLILQKAMEYIAAGLSVIPTVKETKAPALKEWKTYQQRLPTTKEIGDWFHRGDKCIGIVTGRVSGNVEMMDFDHKAELFEAWAALVREESPDLLKRLVLERTQKFGLHAAYRCSEKIPGNLKLAMRPVDITDQVLKSLRDLKVNPEDQAAVRKVLPSIRIEIAGKPQVPRLVDDKFLVVLTMVETRGEGGQFLCAPSPGYELLQGDFTAVPEISAQERHLLIEAAMSLNEWVDPNKVEGQGASLPKEAKRPGDDFNQRGNVASILERHGWTIANNSTNIQHWRRPGKTRGQSASLIKDKIFYVFTQNGSPFEADKSYSPFNVCALLEHGGDYSAAASELLRQGYGKSAASGGDWPDPEPLRRIPEPGEPFPIDALGKILGEAAKAIHLNIKAPLVVCGQSVLATANLAVQGHANVLIDGRSIPVSEFFMSIAPSGDRKSAVDRAALAPVADHQKFLLECYQRDLAKYKLKAAFWKSDYDAAMKKHDSQARREALESLTSAPITPSFPLLTIEEPTYEGLVKLLANGWPSVGIFSDEAGRFFGGHAMSLEHRLKTLAGLSNLWDGKPITRTRAGDGAILLYGRRVCAHFLMQPLVAETILGDPLAHEQGFLSRCLIVAPESTLGQQNYKAQDLSKVAVYGRACCRLSEILQAKLPLKIDPETAELKDELIPRTLLLASDAKDVWVRFHDWIQDHLLPNGIFRPISGIAAKAAEHALRLAATLTLVEDLSTKAISLEHAKNGITLTRFYLTEALRIFHTAKTNPDLLIAEKVLAWLRSREGVERNLVSLPDLYQRGPNVVRDKATASKIMQILSDHGWVRPVEGEAEVCGKKRRQAWEVSSYVFQGAKI